MNCKHFGTCGGCSLPGVAYADQLKLKQARLSRLLGFDVPPLIPSPIESGFRNKIAFVFGPAPRGRGIVMGHFAAGSKKIVPIDECPVHADRGNRLAFALRDRLARAGVSAGLLRHVIIRTTGDEKEAVVMLVVRSNDKSLRTPVRAFLADADPPDGFFINIHDKPNSFMIGTDTIKIAGKSHVKETIGSRESGDGSRQFSFLISPDAFFQTNVRAAAELQRLVIAEAGKARRVLDLYSGSGLFALPIAIGGAHVTAVEENKQAINDLESNLRLNRVPEGRVRAVCARVEDALPRTRRDPWDVIILDPPRDGVSAAAIKGVFREIAPPKAVLVSCNPDALARELPQIVEAGYRATMVQAVDMFPHTEHIETVVVLQKT
jgi:23S rRNA (uracil1939-C5)-methyltransferase